MLIRMLSVHRHECLLQNHEACDKLIQQLTHNETFFNTKAEEKRMLFKQLLRMKHYEGDDYENYREEAIKIGNDLVTLYQ